MFDADMLSQGAMARVEAAIQRCRDGGLRGDRGSQAHALLLEEARLLVEDHLREAFVFDPEDFPAYVRTFPAILSDHVDARDLAGMISEAVRRRIMEALADNLIETVHGQRRHETLADVISLLDEGFRDTLDPIRQFHDHRLKSIMTECRDNPSRDNLKELAAELEQHAADLRTLIHRLDIADPPTADYAGRGRRLLLESADIIDLNLALGLTGQFAQEPARMATP